ncbi:hypothetical protein [Cryptosporangium sp. NPDC048952]|uniref:hypothetical protein n=1 Tax=Cryptosporangium sp. NPDC048952 TaxID=3363961 RepID=UPI0037201C32
MSEARIELRGGPASYTTLTVYRDNNHQLPPTIEMLVADGVLDYKLTSAVTTDGYPIYRCPTNWRLAVRRPEPTPTAAAPETPAGEIDPLDALLAALDQEDAEDRR